MEIIPVIDLLDGIVVHAKRGDRHRYQAIESCLSNSSEPDSIIDGYFTLFPFKNIYIADLNAIQGNSHHLNYLETLVTRFPECIFWVDAGLTLIKEITELQQTNNIRLIIGTENDPSKEIFKSLHKNKTDWVLSLDFLSPNTEVNSSIMVSDIYWPKDIITMMLYRVGTENGIDEKQLQQLKPFLSKHQIYVAGGIANKIELIRLKEQGIHGALIATALHNGALSKQELQSIMS